jgi:hypothetical protein
MSISERRNRDLEYIYIFRGNVSIFISSIVTRPYTYTPLSKNNWESLDKDVNPVVLSSQLPTASNIIQPSATWPFKVFVSNEVIWIYTKHLSAALIQQRTDPLSWRRRKLGA